MFSSRHIALCIPLLTSQLMLASCGTEDAPGAGGDAEWAEAYGTSPLGWDATALPPGKADSSRRTRPEQAWNQGSYRVWEVERDWTEISGEAGLAWSANSGLDWNQKYAAWLQSLEAIHYDEAQRKRTFALTTPHGTVMVAPVLECAEVAIFLRASFASWYGLPFFLEAYDQGQPLYLGHFGFLRADGRPFNRSPRFLDRYQDHRGSWSDGDTWPSDTKLRGRGLYGGGDEMSFLPPVDGQPARAGAYFDAIFLNKRVGHFMLLALSWFGSMHLADDSNMFHLQADSVRSGDVLLKRWQRRGIGHTIPIMRVDPIDEELIEVTVATGSMPRRYPIWEEGPAAARYFKARDAGGPGENGDGELYAKLGGGLRRWRVALPDGNRYHNTFMPSDTELSIDGRDHEAIAARTERFGELLRELSPQEKRDLALAQIEAAREHLQHYPASCAARTRREEAFAELYEVEEAHFWASRDSTDWAHRQLEDYVFAELDYASSRTCCWNSSSGEMYQIIMDLNRNLLEDEASGSCNPPLVFMARDANASDDGYRVFAEHAETLGRAEQWRPWSEDEPCPQARSETTDTEAVHAWVPWCDREETLIDPHCGDTGTITDGAVPLQAGPHEGLRICRNERDVWTYTGQGELTITVKLEPGTADVDFTVLGADREYLTGAYGGLPEVSLSLNLSEETSIFISVYIAGAPGERGYSLIIE